MPVPPAPDGADGLDRRELEVRRPCRCGSTSPAVMPNVKFTLMFVSPGFAAATSVGARTPDGPLPTAVTVTVSGVPSGSMVSFAPTRQPARALRP